jgi:hypothetical protein
MSELDQLYPPDDRFPGVPGDGLYNRDRFELGGRVADHFLNQDFSDLLFYLRQAETERMWRR